MRERFREIESLTSAPTLPSGNRASFAAIGCSAPRSQRALVICFDEFGVAWRAWQRFPDPMASKIVPLLAVAVLERMDVAKLDHQATSARVDLIPIGGAPP